MIEASWNTTAPRQTADSIMLRLDRPKQRKGKLARMPLQLPAGSRFARGKGGEPLPPAAVSEFLDLIGKIAAQGERRTLLEHFKGYFCGAVGAAHYWSSDEGWAHTDLMRYMDQAATTPALFLEAFY